MDSHKHHSSGDEFASILKRESLQQSLADNGMLTHSNQEQVPQFYAPWPTAPQLPYITSSVPQNAAYSTYFMPPCQTTPLQHAMSPYNFLITFINPQSPIPGLRHIAPKPHQAENPITVARSSASRLPDVIETVKQIRKELYALSGISEAQNPPVLATRLLSVAKGRHTTMETCKLRLLITALENALSWKVLIGSCNKHNVFCKSDYKRRVTQFLSSCVACRSAFRAYQLKFCKLEMSLSIEGNTFVSVLKGLHKLNLKKCYSMKKELYELVPCCCFFL